MSKFNLEEEIEKLEYPRMFVAGLKHYITTNKLVIKSKKDLEKIIKDFEKIEI